MPRPCSHAPFVLSALGLLTALGLLAPACGDDAVPAAGGVTVVAAPGGGIDYGADESVVVVDGSSWLVSGQVGAACVMVDGVCVDLADAKGHHCGDPDAQADVIVVDGEVADVICYPPKDAGQPIEEVAVSADGTAEIPQNDNGAVIIFADSTDGEPIDGNVLLSSERASLFGNGVDATFINGDVTIASNNSRIRGLTVMGNVTFDKNANGSAISFCVVYGNLQSKANDTAVLNCQVFGNVKLEGSKPTVVNVGAGAKFEVDPSGICNGNYAFTDADADHLVSDAERGDPVNCTGMAPLP